MNFTGGLPWFYKSIMHNDSHSTPKPSHEEWMPKSHSSTATTSKTAPFQAPIMHFQLCSSICISVYRYALTVFGQGEQSNCYNDIAFEKKRKKKSRQIVWRGREIEVKGRERSSCYSQGTSEDSQHVWAGSEQEASRALQ